MGKVVGIVAAGVAIGALAVATGGIGAGAFGGLVGQVGSVAASAGIGLTATTAGAIAGGLVGAGVVGLSKVGSLVAGSPSIGDLGANTRSEPSFDPRATGDFVFGRTAVPLRLTFEQQHGSDDEFISNVHAHAWHEINAFLNLYAQGEQVSFSGEDATGSWEGILTWKQRRGTTTQTAFSLPNTQWGFGDDFRGVAHSGFIWNFKDQEKLKSGVPRNILVEVEGALLYDPRKDDTVGGSGAHRFDDPSTWEYEPGNPILVALRYLIGERQPDTGDLIWGMGKRKDEIDWPSAIAMANVADEPRDGVPRIQISGSFPLTGDHDQFITSWRKNTGGAINKTGGKYFFWLPHDDLLPDDVIGDDDIVDDEQVVVNAGADIRELFNQASGEYIDPNSQYQAVAFAKVEEQSAIDADGVRRELDIDFPWLQVSSIAQRTARIDVRRSRFQQEWKYPLGPRALQYRPFDVLLLNTIDTGNEDQLVRITDMVVTVLGITLVTLTEEDASIYDDTIPLNEDPDVNSPPPSIDHIGTLTPRFIDSTSVDDLRPADLGATAGGDKDVTAREKNFQYQGRFWTPVGDMEVVNAPSQALEGDYVARTSQTGQSGLNNEVFYPIGPGERLVVQGYIRTSSDYATSDRGAAWMVRWLDVNKNVVGNDRGIQVKGPQTDWVFNRKSFAAPPGTAFANLSAVSNDLTAGTVYFDGSDMVPVGDAETIGIGTPGLLNVRSHPSVVGDRINDDWFGLNAAIQQADSEHRGLYFPQGKGYFITQELPFPVGMIIEGDTPWKIRDTAMSVESVISTGTDGEFKVTLDAGLEFNMHHMVPEDTIRFDGVSSGIDDAGSYGLVSFDADQKTMVVRRPGGGGSELDVTTAPDGAIAIHETIFTGSFLTFRSLDGQVVDGDRHFDSAGNKEFAIRRMGFMGAGVNSQFSGGVLIRRDPDAIRPRAPITNFVIDDFRFTHCSTPGALEIRGALNGYIANGELVKNVFTNLSLPRGDDGGSNTMTTVANVFSHQCTVPFYFRQNVYCKYWNLVMEGAPTGIVLDDCRSCDLHYGWETLSYRDGFGYPLLLLKSNDIRVGTSAGFWNTQRRGFSKAGIVIAGESADSQETMAATITTPYHQGSYDRLPPAVIDYDQVSRTGTVYVDVTSFGSHKDDSFDLEVGPGYWTGERILTFDGAGSVHGLLDDFNQFRMTGLVQRFPFPFGGADVVMQRDPTPDDDDFPVLTTWENDAEVESVGWVLGDNTPGNAVWWEYRELWQIDFEGRLDIDFGPSTGPAGSGVTRVGRNFGVDISTAWPLWWAAETDTSTSGNIRFFLDPRDFFPRNTRFKLDFPSGDFNSFLGAVTLFIARDVITQTITDPSDGSSVDVISVPLNANALLPPLQDGIGAVQTAGNQRLDVNANQQLVRFSGDFVADGFEAGMDVRLLNFEDGLNADDFLFKIETVEPQTLTFVSEVRLPAEEIGSGDEKVAESDTGYIWENETQTFLGSLEFVEFSTGWMLNTDFKTDDESEGRIWLHVKPGRIATSVFPRNKVIARSCLIDDMNGEHTIEATSLTTMADGGGDSGDALEVRVSTQIEADYLQKLDTGVLVFSDEALQRHNQTAVHLTPSNHVEVFDPLEVVSISPEITKSFEFSAGSDPVSIAGADLKNKAPVTIDTSKVAGSGGTLTDKDVLLTEANIPPEMLDPNSPIQSQFNGGDVRFTTDADGNNPIPLQIVLHRVSSTSPGVIYSVRVPSLDQDSNTVIYVWWNSDNNESQPPADDVFGSRAVWLQYQRVWHLNDALLFDATGNQDLTVEAGSLGERAGPFGEPVADFDGNTVLDGGLPTSSAIIVSAWIFRDFGSEDRGFFGDTDEGSDGAIMGARHDPSGFSEGGTDVFKYAADGFGQETDTSGGSKQGVWQMLHILWLGQNDGDRFTAFVDGQQDDVDHLTSSTEIVGSDFNVGTGPRGRWIGGIAEVRQTNGVPASPDDWIATDYANQSDPASFASAGPVEDATVSSGDQVFDFQVGNAHAFDWTVIADGGTASTQVLNRTTVRARLESATVASPVRGTLIGRRKKKLKPADLFGEDRSLFG